METESPPKVSGRTLNAALLTVVATYVVFCGLFGILAALDNASRFPEAENPFIVGFMGLLSGLTTFTYMTFVRGHGFAFLLISIVVVTLLAKGVGRASLRSRLITGALGGALSAGAFQSAFMIMEDMGMPGFAITLTNLTCGAVAGLVGAFLFHAMTRTSNAPPAT
jgi:hypothetical protein